MNIKTAAVIIPAFDCAEFIPDLINGILEQYPTEGWKYEIRIASDNCAKTSDALKKLNIPHFMAVENVGHAILRNALIYNSPADLFLYFDADDKMFPMYIRENIKAWSYGKIIMPAKINTDINLKPKNGMIRVEDGGAMTFGPEIIKALGGFAPYRCAIDTDFMRRAEMAGFKIVSLKKEAYYYRRGHDKALTKAPETGMKSSYRKTVWGEMTSQRKKGIYKIKPDMVKMEVCDG